MKRLVFALVTLALVGLTSMAVAQPSIGIYFDEAGTADVSTIPPLTLGTAYVVVKDANMLLAGAAFGLEFAGDFQVSLLPSEDGLVIGDLESGIEVGLYSFVPNFAGDATVMSTLSYIGFNTVNFSEACVVSHPNYSAPMIANSAGALVEAEGRCATFNIRAIPEIGLFWDTEGTELHKVANGGFDEFFNGYLLVRGAETLVNGAGFKLTNDTPELYVTGVTYAAGATVIASNQGDGAFGLYTGIEMGLPNSVPVFGPDVALLATLNMWAGNSLVEATLNIVNHPNYSAPIIADNNGFLWDAIGLESTLSIPVANEDATWGKVKSLY